VTERRRFTVTAPDWGPAHLSSDAVVAFVDGELAHGPHTRATAHVDACPECAAEVVAQRQARSALRAAACPSLPSSLLSSLRAIPQDTELPAPPAGLAVSSDGQLVSVLRPEPEAAPTHGRRPPAARRLRFGAGAAVSGLAIGALTLGVGSLSGDTVGAEPERGVLGGSVLSPGVAQFGFEPGIRTIADVDARLTERVARMPHTFLGPGTH
jgi:anti-sigma factor RsiW